MAGSVKEAWAVIAVNAITAILSDYYLGDGTALDVLQIALSPALHRPVVTSTDTPIEAAGLVGATAFVSKLAAVPDLHWAFAILC